MAVLSITLIIAMLASFVWASLEMSLARGLASVAGTRWGVVTLVDLGIGLVFVAAWIALLEKSPRRALPWIVAMFLLGNFTTLVYLLWRCRRARTLADLILTPTHQLPPRSAATASGNVPL